MVREETNKQTAFLCVLHSVAERNSVSTVFLDLCWRQTQAAWGAVTTQKNTRLKLDLSLWCARLWQMHRDTDCKKNNKKKSSVLFQYSEMLLQMMKISFGQTASGKCFYKPLIMPCRAIWTRNKIHTIYFFYTQNIFVLSDNFNGLVKSKIVIYILFF